MNDLNERLKLADRYTPETRRNFSHYSSYYNEATGNAMVVALPEFPEPPLTPATWEDEEEPALAPAPAATDSPPTVARGRDKKPRKRLGPLPVM